MKTKNPISIFIVDDDKMFSTALENDIQDVFVSKNIQTRKFEVAETCLIEFKKHVPDIVILDYHLNSKYSDAMNGLEMLKKIKKAAPETDVIMLTREDKVDLAMNLLHHGASDYVLKSETVFRKINYSLLNSLRMKALRTENKTYKNLTLSLIISLAFLFGVFLTLQMTHSSVF